MSDYNKLTMVTDEGICLHVHVPLLRTAVYTRAVVSLTAQVSNWFLSCVHVTLAARYFKSFYVLQCSCRFLIFACQHFRFENLSAQHFCAASDTSALCFVSSRSIYLKTCANVCCAYVDLLFK